MMRAFAPTTFYPKFRLTGYEPGGHAVRLYCHFPDDSPETRF